MLLLVYPDASIAAKIVEDPQIAPIPDLHKAMYAWVKKFVRNSWEMTPADTQALRDAGATEKQIALWAQIACLQTWWVMMGDGGGVSLDYGQEVGPVVGKTRPYYEDAQPGLLAAIPDGTPATQTGDGNGWIQRDDSHPTYQQVAKAAKERYGIIPHLLTATSLAPETLPRHQLAFELLEAPQCDSLTPRQHALVRAITSQVNRSNYFEATIKALIDQHAQSHDEYDKIIGPWMPEDWDETDRAILEFAIKTARNAYKITAKDAQLFQELGLNDQTYVDILNTVAIQTSIERLTNALGIPAEGVLLQQTPVAG